MIEDVADRCSFDRDVTDSCYFDDNDGELLPIVRCVCGKRFGMWEFIVSIYPDDPAVCKYCGRKLYFSNKITVYEVVD